MGLINSKYNEVEKAVLDLSTKTLQIMNIPEPSKTAEMLLNKAIKESQKNDLLYTAGTGDILLDKEKNDENTHLFLEKARREGVRDEDIKWWWNLYGLERIMMLKVDEFTTLALFIKLRDEGLSPEQAGERIRKAQPVYGDSEDTTFTQGDDRPLPNELRDRVNDYVIKRFKGDSEKFKKAFKQSSTCNAFVRKEILAGRL